MFLRHSPEFFLTTKLTNRFIILKNQLLIYTRLFCPNVTMMRRVWKCRVELTQEIWIIVIKFVFIKITWHLTLLSAALFFHFPFFFGGEEVISFFHPPIQSEQFVFFWLSLEHEGGILSVCGLVSHLRGLFFHSIVFTFNTITQGRKLPLSR